MLYYLDASEVVVSIPDHGGPGAPIKGLMPGSVGNFWAQGDQFLFDAYVGDDEPGELRAIPLNGGDAKTIVQEKFFGTPNSPTVGLFHTFLLTDDTLFASYQLKNQNDNVIAPIGVWQADLKSGAESELGLYQPTADQLEASDGLFLDGVVTADWVLLRGLQTIAFPRNGGTPVLMPPLTHTVTPLAVSADGKILWFSGLGEPNENPATEFGLSTIGSPEAPKPWPIDNIAKFYPLTGADDLHGGWYLTGWERLADGALHVTVWSLDSAAHTKRLACDPEVGRWVEITTSGPDGLFIPISAQKLDYYTQIAFVPRL